MAEFKKTQNNKAVDAMVIHKTGGHDDIVGDHPTGGWTSHTLQYHPFYFADFLKKEDNCLVVKNAYKHENDNTFYSYRRATSDDYYMFDNWSTPQMYDGYPGSTSTNNAWSCDEESVRRYISDCWDAMKNNDYFRDWEMYSCFSANGVPETFTYLDGDIPYYLHTNCGRICTNSPVLRGKWSDQQGTHRTDMSVENCNAPAGFSVVPRSGSLSNYEEVEFQVNFNQDAYLGFESVISGDGLTRYIESTHNSRTYYGANGWIAIGVKGCTRIGGGAFDPVSHGYLKYYDLKKEARKIQNDVYYIKDKNFMFLPHYKANSYVPGDNAAYIGEMVYLITQNELTLRNKAYAGDAIQIKILPHTGQPRYVYYAGGPSGTTDYQDGSMVWGDGTGYFPTKQSCQGHDLVYREMTIDEKIADLETYDWGSQSTVSFSAVHTHNYQSSKSMQWLQTCDRSHSQEPGRYDYPPPIVTLARNYFITPAE
jgi:hypothetical protein